MRAAGRRAGLLTGAKAIGLAAASTIGLAVASALGFAAASCGDAGSGVSGAPASAAPSEDERMLAELRRFEGERRAATDFGALPPSDRLLGSDPYVIRAVATDRFAGILRGADALVLLDGQLHELARVAAPPSPSGLAVEGDSAFVVGERDGEIRRYRLHRDRIEDREATAITGARALRDVAVGPNGVLYAVEEEQGRLFTLTPDTHAQGGYDVSSIVAGAGALRVVRTKSAIVVDCLLDHAVVAYRAGADGRPEGKPARIENDGPLWTFDALEDGGGLIVASGGVENKPLDRTHGSFENIDSFVYLDRVTWAPEPHVTRLAEVDVSEHDVVVPKALHLLHVEEGFLITATGYGGESFASIFVRETLGTAGAPAATPEVVAYPLPPGTNAFVYDGQGNMVIANPLLDAWILYRTEHLPGFTVPVPGPHDRERKAASRLGEALIFTTLIAPWNRSNGPLSRFTCETCHFEGYGDGRTHATGRGDVRATTKPLLGLFGNRPHFSRALDPDLSAVAQNEFRVAGARSNHDPVFDLKLAERPWLEDLGASKADLSAIGLRRAFMAFLMDWSHRPSALTAGRTSFTDGERRGATVFRDRCESCHEARLVTDDPTSRVPFERWEPEVLSPSGPIVWGQAKYAKTGVTPYVHDEGARIPSLRRLYKKHPYFTNGTAKTLEDVLSRVRFGANAFFHDGAPTSPVPTSGLSDNDRADLWSFLRLL